MTNVLVITLDDMAQRIQDNQDVLTIGLMPRVESMISQGTLFNQAYAPGAQCQEVRGAVMYNAWPTCSNIVGKGVDRIARNNFPVNGSDVRRFTMDWWFQQNGYNTHGYGKNHHSAEQSEPGWDTYFDDPTAFPNSSNQWPNTTGISLPRNGYPSVFARTGGPGMDWGTWSTANGDARTLVESDVPDYVVTQQWINDLQNIFQADWFSMVGLNYPHFPVYLPEPWASLYDGDTINITPNTATDIDDLPCPANLMYRDGFQPFYEIDDPTPGAETARREKMRWAMKALTYVDHLIDNMMNALAASPFANDTIVVIMSDHGLHFGERERWNKGDLTEQIGNQFMLFWGPGIPAQQIETPVSYMDLMPTLLDLTDTPQRDMQQGKILTPLIEEGESSPKYCDTGAGGEVAFNQFKDFCPGIQSNFWSWRKGDYKIVWYGQDSNVELYNVATDPYEFNNLADSEPALVAEYLEGLKCHHNCITPPSMNHPVELGCVARSLKLMTESSNKVGQVITINSLPSGQLFQYDGSTIGAPIAAGDTVTNLPNDKFCAMVWYIPPTPCDPNVNDEFEWTSTDMNRPWNSNESRATLTSDPDFCVGI